MSLSPSLSILCNLPAHAFIPFSKIDNKDFLAAFENCCQTAQQHIQDIANQQEPPDFHNTVLGMETATRSLTALTALFMNLNQTDTDPLMASTMEKVSPLLAAFETDVLFNHKLFQRIEQIYKASSQQPLPAHAQRLLDKTYKNFIREGVHLSSPEQAKLKAINQRLALLGEEFQQNVLKATHAFRCVLTTKEEVAGIPEDVLTQSYAPEEKAWVFTLQTHSYVPFMTYCSHRHLRKKMYTAYMQRATQGECNNQGVVQEMVQLRCQKALGLGYKSYAHYVLEERMASSPEQVDEFLQKIGRISQPHAERDVKNLQDCAQQEGISSLQSWDVAYYTEKLKEERFAIDNATVKQYFPLPQVMEGAWEIVKKLYGLHIVSYPMPSYHEDVETYAILNEKKQPLAYVYTDLYARVSKRGGAWMTTFRDAYYAEDTRILPHIGLVCNFAKPTGEGTPTLLTFEEVTTFFHELGHVLHGACSQAPYESLSSMHVSWDFVELPSQLLENWVYEEESLKIFAKHYQTKESFPSVYLQKLQSLKYFQAGWFTLRQISLGMLDMAWHKVNNPFFFEETGVLDFEEKLLKPLQLIPKDKSFNMSCSFSHVFGGGYAAGYYSYKWAEMLEADAFLHFKEKGIFCEEVGKAFREEILAKGDTEEPNALYKAFRGKDPDPEAFLKQAGLLAS